MPVNCQFAHTLLEVHMHTNREREFISPYPYSLQSRNSLKAMLPSPLHQLNMELEQIMRLNCGCHQVHFTDSWFDGIRLLSGESLIEKLCSVTDISGSSGQLSLRRKAKSKLSLKVPLGCMSRNQQDLISINTCEPLSFSLC